MFRNITIGLALSAMVAGAAYAETFEVNMLNKGEAGNMVFEPGFLKIAKGDTVKFIAKDKSHNAEAIPEMIPEGVEAFKGKINQEIDVTFDTEGLYGVRCKPHFAMGMVMSIAVGDDVVVPDTFFAGRVPPQAKKRFEAQLSGL